LKAITAGGGQVVNSFKEYSAIRAKNSACPSRGVGRPTGRHVHRARRASRQQRGERHIRRRYCPPSECCADHVRR
jgi:hypothetical protein